MFFLNDLYIDLLELGWYWLATVLCITYKLFSSAKTKQEDRDWIRKWEREEYNRDKLLQREIYLLEEISALKKKESADHHHHLSETETETLTTMESAILKTRQDLWLHKQAGANLVDNYPIVVPGRWTTSQAASCTWKTRRRTAKTACFEGGCCERRCGCCRRSRRTDAGKTTICLDIFSYSTRFLSHCTVERGCCRRERGFKLES